MARFNLDDYETVHQMLIRLHSNYPTARVLTYNETPANVTDRYEFRAEIYLNREDTRPDATGWAYEVIGSTNVNQTSAMENCETSAIGRAINNSILVLGKPNNNRPSREEMEKVQRMSVKATPEQVEAILENIVKVADAKDIDKLKEIYNKAQQDGILHLSVDGKTLATIVGARKKELEA